MLKRLSRPLLIGLGWLSVGLGILGIVFPLFPTTPFLLVAIWAFSRSSPEMAERIRNHRVAGPFIRDWQDEGVIPLKGKLLAAVVMSAMLAYVHFTAGLPRWAEAGAAILLLAVAVYIFTRPGQRPHA